MPKSVPDILEALRVAAGDAATAAGVSRLEYLSAEIGVPVGTLAAWKNRGAIPSVQHWPAVVRVAAALGVEGVTNDLLVEIHSAQKAEARV